MSGKKVKLYEFLRGIPKTEIHLHLEGLASVDTIWKLKEKHNVDLDGIKSREDLIEKFSVTSLGEFIDLFINVIQFCFRQDDDLEYLLDDLLDYLEKNNIIYAEIFVAPTSLLKTGLTFPGIIKTLEKGVLKLEKKGRTVRFIIDVSRGFGLENAMANLDMTLENPSSCVIGIGLGGAELKGPASEFKAVFKKAAEHGLNIVAHAGEDVGPESIWEAINDLGVSRIGHGISAKEDSELRKTIKERNIILEVCPTSNLFTRKYVQKLEEHPIRLFFDEGLFVTVNTDDPALFQVNLIEEYYRLVENDFFTLPELCQLIRNGVEAIFADEAVKQKIREAQKPFFTGI